ncbi:Ku protein [Marinibaculum pumilum]|uniref:Non-homologous end joining protein Ku n=1 Tax=Marinibaculum pumilum TaxID=1766165 RepID=A0ABV7L1T9_9PROT
MAEAPRAYWKGQLRLSLVAVPVTLFAATRSRAALRLHQIHKPSGKRIRYEKVAAGVGPVDPDEIVRGFALDKENYVLIEPEELDEIRLESRDRIDLVQFVDHREIDPRYFDRPYYMAPQDDSAAEGFVVIREALRDAGKVGLGQMAMRGKEYLAAIKPCGRGLLLETLRYADEVRDTDQVFDDIPDLDIEGEMLELAQELIERKSKPFDADAFQDSYAEALRDLIERKRKGKAVVEAAEGDGRGGGQVIDLMEALRSSVTGGGKKGGGKKGSGKSASGSSASGKTSSGKSSSGKSSAAKSSSGGKAGSRTASRRKAS